MATHKLLIISTGGTIAGQVAPDRKDVDYESIGPERFSEITKDVVYSLKKERDIDLEIQLENYLSIDSSDIKSEHWTGLLKIIGDRYDDFDSFVISHGTNTLGYTCAALSFALLNNAKPVILTGSQVPMEVPGSDAKMNLENAIRIATWKKHPINGVIAVFGSHIIPGTRVKKSTEFDYDAFRTFNTERGSIGRIGRIIDIYEDNLKIHNAYLQAPSYPLAKSRRYLEIKPDFDMNIISLTEFPGMLERIFEAAVTRLDIKGFILRSFGAGDVAATLREGLKFLKNSRIPIIITTQAPNGNANMQVNEPGQFILKEGLGIPAYDMGIEAQTTKLAWLLAQKEQGIITYEELCKQMIIPKNSDWFWVALWG